MFLFPKAPEIMPITCDHGCYRWIFNVLPKVNILSDVSLAGAHSWSAFSVMSLLGLWLFFIPSLLHLLINSVQFIHSLTSFSCFLSFFVLHSLLASQPPSGNPICLNSHRDMLPCQTHSLQQQTEVPEAVSLTNLSDL
jgi:hypothetical protein